MTKDQATKTFQKAKEIMEKLYMNLSDPTFTKADILRYLKTNIAVADDDCLLRDVFGTITEEMIYECQEANQDEDDKIQEKLVINQGMFETIDIDKMSAKQKHSFVEIPTIEEARFLEDIYYQTQSKRIVIENQLRSLKQGADNDVDSKDSTKNKTFLEWYYLQTAKMESAIKDALAVFSDSNYISKWAKSVTGIGPVIATCLAANLKLIEDEETGLTNMHAGNWWSYCGLNDKQRPWLGKAKSEKLVQQALDENDGILDDEMVNKLCVLTKWKFAHYEKMARREDGTWSKDKLISASSMIPYNRNMKVLCYKIGHSFLMSKNKEKSLYGRLLKEREALENFRNESGQYADQAAAILAEKKFNKSTTAYQYYSQGKLPPAHISARCRRYVTKLFISHLFEAAYWNRYGKPAPLPYVLSFIDGHADYIGPEVPYDRIPRDEKYVTK